MPEATGGGLLSRRECADLDIGISLLAPLFEEALGVRKAAGACRWLVWRLVVRLVSKRNGLASQKREEPGSLMMERRMLRERLRMLWWDSVAVADVAGVVKLAVPAVVPEVVRRWKPLPLPLGLGTQPEEEPVGAVADGGEEKDDEYRTHERVPVEPEYGPAATLGLV